MYSFRHNFSNVRSLYEITRSETSETIKILKRFGTARAKLVPFCESFVRARAKKRIKKNHNRMGNR
jgi:hypothetical protein